MGVPQTKSELLSAVDKNFSKLINYLNSIPPELTSDKPMDGHAKYTEMSICGLVSYLLGWSVLVVKWIISDAKGQPVDFPETSYKWNQLGQRSNPAFLLPHSSESMVLMTTYCLTGVSFTFVASSVSSLRSLRKRRPAYCPSRWLLNPL